MIILYLVLSVSFAVFDKKVLRAAANFVRIPSTNSYLNSMHGNDII